MFFLSDVKRFYIYFKCPNHPCLLYASSSPPCSCPDHFTFLHIDAPLSICPFALCPSSFRPVNLYFPFSLSGCLPLHTLPNFFLPSPQFLPSPLHLHLHQLRSGETAAIVARELAEQTKGPLRPGDVPSTVRAMAQLVELLDVQLRNLTPGGKDSAARSLTKVMQPGEVFGQCAARD